MIRTLYCWMLSKEVSSAIFKVFGMTRPGIEPRSPEPLANTLPTRPMSWLLIRVLFLNCSEIQQEISSGSTNNQRFNFFFSLVSYLHRCFYCCHLGLDSMYGNCALIPCGVPDCPFGFWGWEKTCQCHASFV